MECPKKKEKKGEFTAPRPLYSLKISPCGRRTHEFSDRNTCPAKNVEKQTENLEDHELIIFCIEAGNFKCHERNIDCIACNWVWFTI